MDKSNILKYIDNGFTSKEVEIEKVESENIKCFMQNLGFYMVRDLSKNVQNNITSVILSLSKNNLDEVSSNLKFCFINLAKCISVNFNVINASSGFGKSALFAVKLLTKFLDSFYDKISEDSLKNLLQILFILPSGCIFSNRKNLLLSVSQILRNLLNKNDKVYQLTLKMLNEIDPQPKLIAFVNILSQSSMNKSDNLKPLMISYVKLCFNDKFTIPTAIISNINAILKMAICNKSDFETNLSTLIPRMTLRAPEKALTIIKYTLCQLNHVDLSGCVESITKSLCVQLSAKSEDLRADSRDSLIELIKLVSEPNSVRQICDEVIKLLLMTGSGKIAQVETRSNIYATLSSFANNAELVEYSSKLDIVDFVIKQLICVVEKENVESLILSLVKCIENWSRLIPDHLPGFTIDFLKNNAINKKNNSNIRFSYLSCLNNCCNRPEKLALLKPVLPQLLTLVDNLSKSLTTPALYENLPLLDLLIRYSIEMDQVSQKDALTNHPILSSIFTIIGFKSNFQQNSKMLTDQFFQNCSIENFSCLISICKSIFTHFYGFYESLPEHMDFILKILYCCCLHHNYHDVRRLGLQTIKLLTTRSQDSVLITNRLIDFISDLNLSSPSSLLNSWMWTLNNEDFDIYDMDSFYPLVQKILQFIDCILSFNYETKLVNQLNLNGSLPPTKYPPFWTNNLRTALIVKCLKPFNQYMLVYFNPDLWITYVNRHVDNYDEMLSSFKYQFINLFMKSSSLDNNQLSLLKCFSSSFSKEFQRDLMNQILLKLNQPQLSSYTQDQVNIMNTRDGYLYNQALLDTLPKYSSKKVNIKKESKLYSYKDQMLEMEINKELEAKKMKNKTKTVAETSDNPLDMILPQLTKNQSEQVQTELDNEKSLRFKMKKVEDDLEFYCSTLEFMAESCGTLICDNLDVIIKTSSHLIINSNLARVRIGLLMLNLSSKMTKLSRADIVWVLRILFVDSTSKFNGEIMANWKFNNTAIKFLKLINPYLIDELNESTNNLLNKYSNQKHELVDFGSFLFLLPAIIQLNDTFSAMELDEALNNKMYSHLLFMEIEKITQIHNWLSDQLNLTNSHHIRQLFRTELLKSLVLSIQCCSCHFLVGIINDNIMKFTELFNVEAEQSQLLLSETNIFENLLLCLTTNKDSARSLGLDCLMSLDQLMSDDEDVNEYHRQLTIYLWIMQFDEVDEIKTKSQELWSDLKLTKTPELINSLMPFIVSEFHKVMDNSIAAMTEIVGYYKNELRSVFTSIFELYKELAYIKPALHDDLGRMIVPSSPDRWQLRLGTAKCLNSLSSLTTELELIKYLFDDFLIPTALMDINDEVRMFMVSTGRSIIENTGEQYMSYFLPLFENYLVTSKNNTVRQCVVIFLGGLAKHLAPTDVRFASIFSKLIDNLSSPSEPVQISVSDTIEPLVKCFDDAKQKQISENLLKVLTNSKDKSESRGAAYGIAGIIKAVGMTKLKSFQIQDVLLEAMQDKTSEHKRQLALFTFEQISLKMGKKFEPYVPFLLKYLQEAFGDPSNAVRQAADRTAKSMMGNLSAPAVKIILSPLLEGLESNQWRTKSVSAEMLGSMAYCAPKQLSNCLPTIVPKILSVLSDSHVNVVKSGKMALKEIGAVIQNKEMISIVPIIIDALCEPTKKTMEGLDVLIDTKFVHEVDPASLALIMSLVTRSFKDRKSESKRKSAHIIANLHSLTKDKDLQPYCKDVLPGLKSGLTDPDPSVREMSAKALGTLAKVMKPDVYNDLVLWLMDTLKDEVSGVNRSGAAQGLSEVLLKKGKEHLDNAMPTILQNTENQTLLPYVRDGYLTLYIYLPKLFRDQFVEYVDQILPSILQALSDEVEYIRETALNAAQTIIEIYSHIAIDTMLPNLENGLLNDNWRIRAASIQLLGDLMFNIIGITGKGTTVCGGDDETFASSQYQTLIGQSLGEKRFNMVLAKLYLSRLDVSQQVRTTSVHIWKLIVFNTVRTLRQIMSSLMQAISECLSSENEDNKIMATKTVSDLVRKIGERAIPDIFNNLVEKFDNCELKHRVGVCDTFAAILKACPKEEVSNYLDYVLPTFKICITNDKPEIREHAVKIFDALHHSMGNRILEIVIPDLVDQLDDETIDEDLILGALCTLVSLKGRVIMPTLIPRLTSPRVRSKALSYLAKVAGDIMGRHIVTVLPALFSAVADKVDTEAEEDEIKNCTDVILAMEEPQLMSSIFKELLSTMSVDKSHKIQTAGLRITSAYMLRLSELDAMSSQSVVNNVPLLIRSVIKLFICDGERSVLVYAFDCLININKSLSVDSVEYVKDIRDSFSLIIREQLAKVGLSPVGSDESQQPLIPALCLPERGIVPLIDIFRESLINGRAELKEIAASGFDDCITLTTNEILAKAAVKIAGPLIRTMSDRHNSATRAAVVSALGKLIYRCSNNIKLFASQIQTIFLKSLTDSSHYLRYKAQLALAKLIVVINKPDQLFNELMTQELSEINEYKYTGLEAIRMCLDSGGNRLSHEVLLKVKEIFQDRLGEKDDQMRMLNATILAGSIISLSDPAELYQCTSDILSRNTTVLNCHSLSVFAMAMCKNGCYKLFDNSNSKLTNLMLKSIEEYCNSDKTFVASVAYRSLGYIASYLIGIGLTEQLHKIFDLINKGIKHSSIEIRDLVIDICGYIVWKDNNGANITLYVTPVSEILVTGYRSKETTLKVKSEKRILDLMHVSIGLRRKNNQQAQFDEIIYKLCCDNVSQNIKPVLTEILNRYKKTYLSIGSNKEIPTQCPVLDNTYNKVPANEASGF